MSRFLLTHALNYAQDGLAVFPCNADKTPAVAGGFHSATTDVAQVHAWWTSNPDALIGCAVPEGIVVIDIDPRNGGTSTMRALADTGLEFPATRVAGTGSGGIHRWYSVPTDVALVSTAGPGVDVKRHGKGYVILPPSISEAGPYEWRVLDDPAPLPASTLDFLRKPEPVVTRTDFVRTDRAPWETATSYGHAALRAEIATLLDAPAGDRNNTLNRAAFAVLQLVHGGEIDEDLARDELLSAALEIGLPRDEVEGTLISAYAAAARDPRVAPAEHRASVPTAVTGPVEDHAEDRFWTNWEVDEPAPPFYLWPVLPKNAYVLVYGATEASKSMVWNALLAQGSHHGIKSSVYSLENPAHVDRSRLRRLGPDPACFRIAHQHLDLSDHAQAQALIKREREWDTDVVLIDTYSHAFNSRSDDGNAKAVEFARVVRYIMAETGCTVVVVDHTGYANREEPRDASAKRQQVDVAILMEREGTWRQGQPSRFRMTNMKAARFANPFEDERGAIIDTEGGGLELQWHDADWAQRWQA